MYVHFVRSFFVLSCFFHHITELWNKQVWVSDRSIMPGRSCQPCSPRTASARGSCVSWGSVPTPWWVPRQTKRGCNNPARPAPRMLFSSAPMTMAFVCRCCPPPVFMVSIPNGNRNHAVHCRCPHSIRNTSAVLHDRPRLAACADKTVIWENYEIGNCEIGSDKNRRHSTLVGCRLFLCV